MALKYDVEADWTLLTACNYRCAYCFYSPGKLSVPLQAHASAKQWAEGFDATGRTWLIHMTGGEPTIYPGFVDLCRNLSRNHFLSFNTNLAGNCCEAFAETIDPQRVSFIHAALHYEEREKRNSFDLFVRRAIDLRFRGFNVMLTMVMTPDIIRLYPEISARLASHGLPCIPKIMRGRNWNGKNYPDAYADEEKVFFLRYLADAAQAYEPLISAMDEPPTVDFFADGRFIDEIPSYLGKRCGSGSKFVWIDPIGVVRRCVYGSNLGNILKKNVKLLSAPAPCMGSGCHYFCEKYTSAAYVGRQPLSSITINRLISFLRGKSRTANHQLS